VNKATARHLLRRAGWSEAEIVLAERVMRHDGTRRRESVLPTLTTFAERHADSGNTGEHEAWTRLIEMLRTDPALVDAVAALLTL